MEPFVVFSFPSGIEEMAFREVDGFGEQALTSFGAIDVFFVAFFPKEIEEIAFWEVDGIDEKAAIDDCTDVEGTILKSITSAGCTDGAVFTILFWKTILRNAEIFASNVELVFIYLRSVRGSEYVDGRRRGPRKVNGFFMFDVFFITEKSKQTEVRLVSM